MTFLHPEFLYYILPFILILFGFLLIKKEAQATFFSIEVMNKLRVSRHTLSLRTRNILFLFMSILLVVAISNPIVENGKIEIKAKSSDIMIALDISDSMLAEDVYPNRLKLAKQKALEFLHLAPNERIGVIGFAQNSYLVSPLSFDHSAVKFLLSKLDTDSITEKGTNFLSMLEVVQKSIKTDSNRYILIFSDGGDKDNFSKEIEFAKDNNIVVYVLGVGTKKGAPIKKKDGSFIKQYGNIIVSKLNDNISKLATNTGGVYIKSVNSDSDVKAMLREIERHSVKRELKSQEINRYISYFYYPLGLALFILLIATSSFPQRNRANIFMIILFFTTMVFNQNAEAGVLDFIDLGKAKDAYGAKDYAKSAKIYNNYADSTNKAEANYNLGNALYKQGKYKEAIKSYKKVNLNNKKLIVKNLANLGNAYAKEGTEDSLKKAIKSYEASLKLRKDKDTQENLEAVKKALKQQKDKEKKKDKKNKSDKKSKSDKKDDKSKKKDKEKQKKSDKKDKSDKKSKSDKKDDKFKKKNKKQNKQKDKAEEIKDENQNTQAQAKPKMSDEEEKKWLKKLNKQQSTFIYRLNAKTPKKENENEKPW